MIKKISVLACVVLLTASIYARPPIGSHGEMGSDGPPPMAVLLKNIDLLDSELGLSDKQLKAIEKINRKHKSKHLAYSEIITPVKLKVKRLSLEDDVNYDDIRVALESISDTLVNMKLDMIRHNKEIESELSSKQRMKLKRLFKKSMFKKMHFRDKK